MDDFFKKKVCDRCGHPLVSRTMSMFNTDVICLECKLKEKRDPRYKEAQEAELNAVRHGDYNFKGIGR